ncbi:Protein RFT1 [Folsomia candida]|uniref:Protein RFT1 homolog n=1 Tax=Folsomia candida TaxID=158441 RepID=A0A226ED27_FOLCA|nr:Protein RFT1 [Folsomia candida]
MAGSPRRSRAERRKPDQILSGSVKSASYNIVFQVLTRIFTFALNAFILRYVSHEVLGVCNVRLALLYSSVMFLSREPFRRAVLRKKETDSWSDTVNLIWLVVPVTTFWSLLFGYTWANVLSNPGPSPDSAVAQQYRSSVWCIVFALIVDSFSEIVGDTTLIMVRSIFLLWTVIFYPSYSILGYAVGSFVAVLVVGGIYYGYFYYYIGLARRDIPFFGVKDFFPRYWSRESETTFPTELGILSWSFFKQGILKQLLTEGERYLMTFFDILAFDEQGVYDLVANLGSLAARFIFLPKLAQATAEVLGNLVKMMLLIGSVMIVYGIPYSNTVLFLYGGSKLSEQGPGTRLLQANCAYIFIMALNGVTEAFTFAAMTQAQMDKFNRRLIGLSCVVLAASYLFTRLFGSVGFFLANSVNMGLRVWQRYIFIYINRSIHVAFGIMIFGGNCLTIYHFDRELIQFFVKIFKSKSV